MKIIFALLVAVILPGRAHAQFVNNQVNRGIQRVPVEGGSVLDNITPDPAELRRIAVEEQAREAQQQRIESLNRDPWRIINGVTNRIDLRWSTFTGQVQQVMPDGILVFGSFGNQAMIDAGEVYNGQFFIARFPYAMADGETIQPNTFFAMPNGVYTTAPNHTARELDYGIVWQPPPLTPEQIASLKANSEARKEALADKVLKYDEDAASKGDAYGLLRMGERYRDGDGMAKDPVKAKDYLTRAAAAGSPTAADDLKGLPAQ